jgi:hypothetical protein
LAGYAAETGNHFFSHSSTRLIISSERQREVEGQEGSNEREQSLTEVDVVIETICGEDDDVSRDDRDGCYEERVSRSMSGGITCVSVARRFKASRIVSLRVSETESQGVSSVVEMRWALVLTHSPVGTAN